MPNIKNNKRGILPCEVEGCDRLIFAKDWCKKHYDRYNTHGDPTTKLPTGRKEGEFDNEAHFWSNVFKMDGDDPCWLWGGHKSQRKDRKGPGYGRMQVNKKSVLVHRYSYAMANKDDLLPYEPVHHTCGNTLCVNPKHLQKTTSHANTAEMLERNWYIKRIAELEAQLAECDC